MIEMTIESWWKDFAERAGLNRPGITETQRTAMRQAFYAGVGSLLLAQKQRVAEMSDEAGAEVLAAIELEVTTFFLGRGIPS